MFVWAAWHVKFVFTPAEAGDLPEQGSCIRSRASRSNRYRRQALGAAVADLGHGIGQRLVGVQAVGSPDPFV
jgi:hypothetical protein